MPLVVRLLDRAFYSRGRLSDLPDWIVINATNLRTGKAWKFFNDRAGDYLGSISDVARLTTPSSTIAGASIRSGAAADAKAAP